MLFSCKHKLLVLYHFLSIYPADFVFSEFLLVHRSRFFWIFFLSFFLSVFFPRCNGMAIFVHCCFSRGFFFLLLPNSMLYLRFLFLEFPLLIRFTYFCNLHFLFCCPSRLVCRLWFLYDLCCFVHLGLVVLENTLSIAPLFLFYLCLWSASSYILCFFLKLSSAL